MKIVYRPHLKERLKQREIPPEYPRQIIQSPEQEYFDTLAKRNVSIKKLNYKGIIRSMVVAYDIIKRRIEVVTIHVISKKEIKNKI